MREVCRGLVARPPFYFHISFLTTSVECFYQEPWSLPLSPFLLLLLIFLLLLLFHLLQPLILLPPLFLFLLIIFLLITTSELLFESLIYCSFLREFKIGNTLSRGKHIWNIPDGHMYVKIYLEHWDVLFKSYITYRKCYKIRCVRKRYVTQCESCHKENWKENYIFFLKIEIYKNHDKNWILSFYIFFFFLLYEFYNVTS